MLNCILPVPPKISAIKANDIAKVLEETNYTFLFAPNFHQGMKYADPVRRGLGIRTIFNLMGPLANPVDWALEARVVGVAYQSLGPIFIEALRLGGSKKALVICGEEDMDEISCAGPTNCWRLSEYPNPAYKPQSEGDDDDDDDDDEESIPRTLTKLDVFQLHPRDFGFPTHPISDVYTKKLPKKNAEKLMSILRNELDPEDPLMHFVLMNTSALLVTSGVCEAETSNMGPRDDGKVITERGPGGGRWKEGVRRARYAITSGHALKSLEKFIDATNRL